MWRFNRSRKLKLRPARLSEGLEDVDSVADDSRDGHRSSDGSGGKDLSQACLFSKLVLALLLVGEQRESVEADFRFAGMRKIGGGMGGSARLAYKLAFEGYSNGVHGRW